MRSGFVRYCGLVLAIALGLAAQTRIDGAIEDPAIRSTLSQAMLGIVFDASAQAIRPVVGAPGAAVFGRPLELGGAFTTAAVSPRQDYILASAAGNSDLLLFRIRNGSIVLRPLPGAVAAPDRIVLSPTGASAALYYPDSGTVRVISGMPDNAFAASRFDLPFGPSVLAVSDDGRSFIASGSFAGEDQTFQWTDDTGLVRIFAIARTNAAVFFPQSRDAVLADGSGNRLLRLRLRDGSPELTALAGSADGVAGPVSVAVSANGRRIFVANRDSNSVLAVDLTGTPPALLACLCTPSALTPMGGALFRLTEPDGKRFWLLDAGAAAARIVFVPLDAPDEAQL